MNKEGLYEQFYEEWFKGKKIPSKNPEDYGYNEMDMNKIIWQIRFLYWQLKYKLKRKRA